MTENGFRIQLRLYEAANTFREIIEADEGFRLFSVLVEFRFASDVACLKSILIALLTCLVSE